DAVTGQPPPGPLPSPRALWPARQSVGWAVTGVRIDDAVVRSLPASNAALVEGGRVVGASSRVPSGVLEVASQEDAVGTISTVGGHAVTVETVADDLRLLVWEPAPGVGLLVLAWIVLLAWALIAVLLTLVAVRRGVSDPLVRAAAVARHAADGDLEHRLDPAGATELRELSGALNDMGVEMDRRLRELADSRDQLRGALSRLGETLSSSLNLDRTLAVVTDTAMDTVQADRAMLVLTTENNDLDIKIDRGFDLPEATRFDGHSLPGWVARTGLSVRLPADRVVISTAVAGGILAIHQLSVPVTGTATGGRIGALLLARPDAGPAFTEDDLRTVRTFAGQAGVAIENVLLHQEARRLSLTDPLTELWNFRYFQLQALREVEAATRYGRPLGLLIVDLDHFKRVNDRHGHPVGDQVLAEVGRRIRTSTRLPDIVARYGGEEFVLLLPGTDAAGAVVTAERIRRRVARLPIVAGGQDALRISVTCSVGVAAYPQHGATVDELLRRADVALYTAKSQGRDRVVNADDVGAEVRVPVTHRDSRVGAH
ncbi:MAG: diguanylate cyclase, partial [Actinobacteria bacterium]|nr:diguanylate cyclase [Actinomycetota bacterium]